jgi:hypothetical protein
MSVILASFLNRKLTLLIAVALGISTSAAISGSDVIVKATLAMAPQAIPNVSVREVLWKPAAGGRGDPAIGCERAWQTVLSPNVGNNDNTLRAVAALAPDDIWAAGGYSNINTGEAQHLLTHWNGQSWNIVPGPPVWGNSLRAVGARASNDVWAVGSVGTSAGPVATTMHWDGSEWSYNYTAISGTLRGVTALASDDAWAVGYRWTGFPSTPSLIMHWTASGWAAVPSPNPGTGVSSFSAVDAISSDDIWAVGNYDEADLTHPLTVHWDGKEWSHVPSPNFGMRGAYLSGVAAVTSDDVWAVGSYQTEINLHTFIIHWDGKEWSYVPSPSPATTSTLTSVAANASDDVWTVGSWMDSQAVYRTLAMHWDGSQWSVVPSPNPISGNNRLEGVAFDPTGGIWAVGVYVPLPAARTLVMRYPPPCATVTPTPASTLTPTSTTTTAPPSPTATLTATATATATTTATTCPITFTDVNPPDFFYTAVRYLACRGAISGYSDGTFRPYNDTTRGQVSKIVVLAESFPLNTAGGPHFTDVDPANPFYPFIETAYNRALVSGYSDGTFRWGANVTRGQLSKIVVQAEGWPIDLTGAPHFSDVGTSNPFYAFIETAYNSGIISGYSDGTFRPGNDATRGQISKIVHSAIAQP